MLISNSETPHLAFSDACQAYVVASGGLFGQTLLTNFDCISRGCNHSRSLKGYTLDSRHEQLRCICEKWMAKGPRVLHETTESHVNQEVVRPILDRVLEATCCEDGLLDYTVCHRKSQDISNRHPAFLIKSVEHKVRLGNPRFPPQLCNRTTSPCVLVTNGLNWRLVMNHFNWSECCFIELDLGGVMRDLEVATALAGDDKNALYLRSRAEAGLFMFVELFSVHSLDQTHGEGDAFTWAMAAVSCEYRVAITKHILDQRFAKTVLSHLFRYMSSSNRDTKDLEPQQQVAKAMVLFVHLLATLLVESVMNYHNHGNDSLVNVVASDKPVDDTHVEQIFWHSTEAHPLLRQFVTNMGVTLEGTTGHTGLYHALRELGRGKIVLAASQKGAREAIHLQGPIDFSLLDPAIIGCFYERHMGARVGQWSPDGSCIQFDTLPRHDLGVFYTPKSLVVHIVQKALCPTLDTWENEMRHCTFQEASRIWTLKIKKLRVLDHAMGSGRFLCETVKYIVSRAVTFLCGLRVKENNAPSLDDGRDIHDLFTYLIIEHCVFGVDVHAVAVNIGRISLLICAISNGEKPDRRQSDVLCRALCNHLVVNDSLLGPCPLRVGEGRTLRRIQPPRCDHREKGETQSQALDWFWFLGQCDALQGFDVILGNPPWTAARNDTRAHRGSKTRLRQFIVQSENYPLCRKIPGGHANTWYAFLERLACLLKPGGRFGYIIPDTILAGNTTKLLRYLFAEPVTESCAISSVGRLTLDTVLRFARNKVWKNVSQGCAVLIGSCRRDKGESAQFRFHVSPDCYMNSVREGSVSDHLVSRGSCLSTSTNIVDLGMLPHRILVEVVTRFCGQVFGNIPYMKHQLGPHIHNQERSTTQNCGDMVVYYKGPSFHFKYAFDNYSCFDKGQGGPSYFYASKQKCAGAKRVSTLIDKHRSSIVARICFCNRLIKACRLPATGYIDHKIAIHYVDYGDDKPNHGWESSFLLGLLNSAVFEFLVRSMNAPSIVEYGLNPLADIPFPFSGFDTIQTVEVEYAKQESASIIAGIRQENVLQNGLIVNRNPSQLVGLLVAAANWIECHTCDLISYIQTVCDGFETPTKDGLKRRRAHRNTSIFTISHYLRTGKYSQRATETFKQLCLLLPKDMCHEAQMKWPKTCGTCATMRKDIQNVQRLTDVIVCALYGIDPSEMNEIYDVLSGTSPNSAYKG